MLSPSKPDYLNAHLDGPFRAETDGVLYARAARIPFDLAPNTSVFWSGPGQKDRAEAFCERRAAKGVQTLGMHVAKHDRLLERDLAFAERFIPSLVPEIWEMLSARFAAHSVGDVTVFLPDQPVPNEFS